MAVKGRISSSSMDRFINVVDAIKMALLRQGLVRPAPTVENTDKPQKSQSVKSKVDIQNKALATAQPRSKEEAEASQAAKQETKDLAEVANLAHEILYKVDTVFPFTLFPDTITLEREKISIAKRFFFKVAKIIHIPVRDLLHVEIDVGPFFGSVHITSRFFSAKPFTVNYLWKDDALQLQKLLQGYIIAYERDIDCIKIEKEKLINLLRDLGAGDTK